MPTAIIVYCIAKPGTNNTYVGYTVNWARRIRQHNGEIKNGARSTRKLLNKGTGPWAPLFHVTGFKTQRHAKQLEWLLHSTHEKGSRCRKKETRREWRLRRLKEAFPPVRDRFTTSAPVTDQAQLEIVYF
jgi:structure-specific endonuclease subunit SLX1